MGGHEKRAEINEKNPDSGFFFNRSEDAASCIFRPDNSQGKEGTVMQKQNLFSTGITGILGAMEEEVSLLREEMQDRSERTVCGRTFYSGTLRGKQVVLCLCGIGKVHAGVCAALLIEEFGCTRILNTGVAGSLRNEIDILDMVISTDAVQHDMDVTPLGYAPGEFPDFGCVSFPADEEMRQALKEAARKAVPESQIFEGRVCSGDQFIDKLSQRERINAQFDGSCCEMEGGAIAQVCAISKTPYVILRAISDKPDGSEQLEYPVFVKEAAERSARVTLQLFQD